MYGSAHFWIDIDMLQNAFNRPVLDRVKSLLVVNEKTVERDLLDFGGFDGFQECKNGWRAAAVWKKAHLLLGDNFMGKQGGLKSIAENKGVAFIERVEEGYWSPVVWRRLVWLWN